MSLFRVREYWSCKASEENSVDVGSLLVADITNHKDASKLVVGDINGTLRIYQIAERNYNPTTDILLEETLPPILQLGCDAFKKGSSDIQLVVLHPRLLTIYEVSEGKQGASLKKIFNVKLKRTAANFVSGNFGNSGQPIICVQSMDGALMFFNQSQSGFERFIPDFLVPGPLIYLPQTDTIVTANSQWAVCGYKFLVITSSDQKNTQDQLQAGTGKRITSDWLCNVGEEVLQIQAMPLQKSTTINLENRTATTISAITEGSAENISALLVLGRTSLFWLNEEGLLLKCKRMDCDLSCFTVYKTPSSVNILLCATDGIARVLNQKKVLWAAGGLNDPVAVTTTTQCGIQGLIVVLDGSGTLSCVYLGTDPSLPQLAKSSSEDQDFMEDDIKKLRRAIAAATEGKLRTKKKDDIDLDVHVTDVYPIDLEPCEEFPNVVFDQSITVSLSAPSGKCATNVEILATTSFPIILSPSSIPLGDHEVTDDTTVDIPVAVTILPSFYLPSLRSVLSLTYRVQGEPHTMEIYADYPITLAYDITAPEKSAAIKLTLSSSLPCITMNELYADLSVSDEPASAVGFQRRGMDDIVSVISANRSSRYRIQGSSWASIAPILTSTVDALRKYYKNSDVPLHLSLSAMPDLESFFEAIDVHFKLRVEKKGQEADLEKEAEQFRILEKRFLSSAKDMSETSIEQVSMLLGEVDAKIVAVSEDLILCDEKLKRASCTLASASFLFVTCLRLVHDLTDQKFEDVASAVSTFTDTVEGMGWEERTLQSIMHFLHIHKKNQGEATILPQEMVSNTNELKKHISMLANYFKSPIAKK
eukprot:m.36916 g.36916  ORF g.36916 m.36916 type:complete len:818 (+) comp6707_c0_seq1:22-2475(+)